MKNKKKETKLMYHQKKKKKSKTIDQLIHFYIILLFQLCMQSGLSKIKLKEITCSMILEEHERTIEGKAIHFLKVL